MSDIPGSSLKTYGKLHVVFPGRCRVGDSVGRLRDVGMQTCIPSRNPLEDGRVALQSVNCHHERSVARLLSEIHAGEILLEDFLEPMGITARKLAADIDVPPSRISELVNGARPVTADTALRLGLFFSMDPRFWLNLQTEYDMRVAVRELKAKIAPRIRVFHPA